MRENEKTQSYMNGWGKNTEIKYKKILRINKEMTIINDTVNDTDFTLSPTPDLIRQDEVPQKSHCT